MPWSNKGGDGGGWQGGGDNKGGPWGQGPNNPGGRGPAPPELEDLIKKGQEKIRDILPGGTGKGGSGKFVWLLGVAAVAAFVVYRGFYQVQADQVGIELLFGAAKDGESPPGLHHHFWPFETVETPAVEFENVENIGAGTGRGNTNEGLMLTSDQNIVQLSFTVLWRISDPRNYLFNVRDQQQMIRFVAESAMREIVGQTNAQEIRTTGRDDAEAAVTQLIQATLDSYGAGIRVTGVKIEKAEPPPAVTDAFEEVQRAKQDQSKFIEEAQRYANQILGQARGRAAQIREQAQAYKERVVAEATGEAQRFVLVYDEYKKAPAVTRKRLFLETLETVLEGSNKVIIEQGNQGTGVVPYLPLPEIQKRNPSANKPGGE